MKKYISMAISKVTACLVSTFALIAITVGGQNNLNKSKMESNQKYETITLGAGCFWCVEAIYSRVNGVVSVTSGYSGGHVEKPTYQDVCTGSTGHAEVIQVVYDPKLIPLGKVLEIYFKTHDPTTLNQQGADIGTQYRSVIFYQTDEQKRIAQEVKDLLNKSGIYSDPIVTAIEPFKNFYKAETYHQDYFANNKKQPYCQMVINPKVEKFEKLFKDYLKKK
jgi:peptide-methionine (S)-S-oxide reductase